MYKQKMTVIMEGKLYTEGSRNRNVAGPLSTYNKQSVADGAIRRV